MMGGSTTMRTSLRVAMFGAEVDEAALRTWSQSEWALGHVARTLQEGKDP